MFRPSLILRLRVNRNDYVPIEDQFDSKIMNDIVQINADMPFIYDSIPEKFITLEEYPIETNLCCWYCDRVFYNKRPVFISPSIREVNGKIEFDVCGNFCSFNCAVSWINTNYNGDTRDRITVRLMKLFEVFTGGRCTYITPAHPKTIMKRYGGHVTKDQYDEMMNEINPENKKD